MNIPSIIEAVEFRREQYGLTQKQWAYVLKMQPSHYSEFLHGKKALPYRCMAIAFEYGVPAECLFQRFPMKGAKDIAALMEEMQRRKAKELP